MFKVVDNNLTTIFNRVQDITTGVNLSTDSVNRYVDVFNKLNAIYNFLSYFAFRFNDNSLTNK